MGHTSNGKLRILETAHPFKRIRAHLRILEMGKKDNKWGLGRLSQLHSFWKAYILVHIQLVAFFLFFIKTE